MKKLSVSKIDEGIKNNLFEVKKDWNGNEIIIKKFVGYETMLDIVNKTVDACFDRNGNYLPEMRDMAFREQVISGYSNAAIPSPISHKYDILYMSGIYEIVLCEIDSNQLNSIKDAIYEKTEYRADVNVQRIYSKIEEVTGTLQTMAKEMVDVFNGITREDVQTIMNAIANGKIDEGKIVEAYMKNK